MAYLITGATGDVGSKVVAKLLRLGMRPRVLVRDEGKARQLLGDGVEMMVGDLGESESLRQAMKGTSACFLVNCGPEIPKRDAMAAEAAKETGLRHLVKLSSMDVEQGLAIGGWHERGEEAIRRSGVPYTSLRPAGFMSNLLAWARSIRAQGVVWSSTGEGRRAFIHSEDIAGVAVKALTGVAGVRRLC